MTDTKSIVKAVLEDAGYSARYVEFDKRTGVNFEDETLMGFVIEFDSTQALIDDWPRVEKGLLTKYSQNLREAGDKAWNVYLVCFTSSATTGGQERLVRWIEENLERTRKLAACAVETRADIERLLLPLLPIQFRPSIELLDVTKRLQARINAIAPSVDDIALESQVAAADVASALRDQQ